MRQTRVHEFARRDRLLTLLVVSIMAGSLSRGQPLPEFVGGGVCLGCHSAGRDAPTCACEPIPAHDRAYRVLGSSEAEEIAVLTGGIAPPPEDRLCLGCHATAADDGPRWTRATFDPTAGVQCEACHGAGSDHVQARLAGAACRSGEIRRGDRAACTQCHTPRFSHEEVLKRGFRRTSADRQYRTLVKVVPGRANELYVCCEHADRMLALDADTGAVLREVRVGRRPHSAALSPDGRLLFVSNRLSNTVSIVDLESFQVRGEVAVGAEPHGLAVDSSGQRLFVLNTGQDSVSVVDIAKRIEVSRLDAGVGPWALAYDGAAQRLHVTNVRPNPAGFREPHHSEITVIATDAHDARGGSRVVERLTADGANMVQGIARVPNRGVVLFTLMRTKNLVPITRVAQGWTTTNGLGVVWPDGRIDQVLLDEPNAYFPDPTDIAVSPDGRLALVTSGGADEVAVVDVAKLLETISTARPDERVHVLPNHLGSSARFVVARIPVGANPRSVAFAPDGRRAYVANALDDTLSVIDTQSLAGVRTIRLGGPDDISPIRRGERLFHNAGISFGRQFSCRSCHPDGHVDGLAFDIEADGLGQHPVDNRSLRGVGDTGPFKWEGTNPSLHRQCGPRFAVFFTRLTPYTSDEQDALVRYICTIERPPNPYRDASGLTPSQRRGKLIFERTTSNTGEPIPAAQRCITCHANAYRSAPGRAMVGSTMWFDQPADADLSNLRPPDEGPLGVTYYYSAGGPMKSFDIAHLTGVAAAPPYLHNGGAATLEELWTRFNTFDAHGMTNDLTRRQFNDLIAYLRTF